MIWWEKTIKLASEHSLYLLLCCMLRTTINQDAKLQQAVSKTNNNFPINTHKKNSLKFSYSKDMLSCFNKKNKRNINRVLIKGNSYKL